MQVWGSKSLAKKNGFLMEEWLTEQRAKSYKKCKVMKSKKLIKDCYTQDGDVIAVLLPKPGELSDIDQGTVYGWVALT